MTIKVFNDYEVDDFTFALLPSYHTDFSTIAIDVHHVFGIRKSALQLLNVACLNGGADYAGRRNAVLHKMGQIRKAPIPVDPKNLIYTFPTHAPNHPDCAWLFLNHIKDVQDCIDHPGCSTVYFSNGMSVLIKASRHSIMKQMYRTSHCITHFSPPFHRYPSFDKRSFSFFTQNFSTDKTEN